MALGSIRVGGRGRRRSRVRGVALLAVLVASFMGCARLRPPGPADTSEVLRPPNLIVVMADDQGYGDWQAHEPRIHTPHMLSLAEGGFVFDDYHAMVACSPTRAALLTGRDGRRTGVTGLMNHRNDDHRFMNPEELTIAELLRQRGYRTALIGKWHLSDRPGSVRQYGFDEFFGFLRGSTRYVDPENFYHNTESVGRLEGYSTDLLADEASRFIRENRDEPFFLLLTPNAPHEPLVGKAEDLAHYSAYSPDELRERRRNFYATVSSLDRAIGRVQATLEELDLVRDTILLVTSDNGSSLLRRGKGTLYGGGSHVPMIVWSPDRIAAGSTAQLVGVLDLFPTLADWANAPLPEPQAVDGRSLTSLIASGNATGLRPMLFREWSKGFSAFDDRYRLIVYPVVYQPMHAKLFDLVNDPDERNNLLESDLDGVRPIYRAMLAALTDWQREVRGKPLWTLPALVPSP